MAAAKIAATQARTLIIIMAATIRCASVISLINIADPLRNNMLVFNDLGGPWKFLRYRAHLRCARALCAQHFG